MPFLEDVGFFVGRDILSDATQILVNQHLEVWFPVIPFQVEGIAGDSNQLVQRFPEAIELPTHGFIFGGSGRRISPLGLGGEVHQDLVVPGMCPGV